MGKKGNSLSITQGQFIDYINANLKENNRIIFYKNKGHFGLDYAVSSHFKRAEIIRFDDLKNKKGRNLLFRILNIGSAIATCILNQTEIVDARVTVSTLLSNMENIYLGIDKEKEYLKYLNIRRIPYKYWKIRFVIRVEEKDIQSDQDMQCLKLLCKLIESGKINNTLLLVSGENLNALNFAQKMKQDHIPQFQLTEQDIEFFAFKNHLDSTETIGQNVELIQKFGIDFFLDHSNYFEALFKSTKNNYNWKKKMDWIIGRMIQDGDISPEELYPLLEFASFFEKYFSKLEIKNFRNNELGAENLGVASQLHIINEEKASRYVTPRYSFKLDSFKDYFSEKYYNDVEPLPKFIYQYFRENYPFEYNPALKLLSIPPEFVSYEEKQSLIIIGYYYQCNEKGYVRYEDFKKVAVEDTTAFCLINAYECFKRKLQDEPFVQFIHQAIRGLFSNSFDEIAICAGCVMLLQMLKENYILFPDIKFDDILSKFKSHILSIKDIDNYNKYWIGHFKCQYIALSLEDENTNDNTARKFLADIKRLREIESFSFYIRDNQLRGFTRIDLIAFSLGIDNAGKVIESLYNSAQDSTILKELARINYSAYLIENENYDMAERILKIRNLNFIENINIDTYGSYLNNLYVAQLYNHSINKKTFSAKLEELITEEVSYSDRFIIKNNLSVAFLLQKTREKEGEEQLKQILENGNPYSRFLAAHNLLSYYFTKNDCKNFMNVYEKIYIPKLLLADKTFFEKKFKWLKDNIGRASFEQFKPSSNVTPIYNNLYIMSSIERWFE